MFHPVKSLDYSFYALIKALLQTFDYFPDIACTKFKLNFVRKTSNGVSFLKKLSAIGGPALGGKLYAFSQKKTDLFGGITIISSGFSV